MPADTTPRRQRRRAGPAALGVVALAIGGLWLLLAKGSAAGAAVLALGGALLQLSLTSSSARDVGRWSRREWSIAIATALGCVVLGVVAYVLTGAPR